MSEAFQQQKEVLLKQYDDLLLPIWWHGHFLYRRFSTRHLIGFYDPHQLKRILQALVALEIVINFPYIMWRFQVVSPNLELWSFDDWSGNDFDMVFGPEGILIKGFDHESEMSPYCDDNHTIWPGIYDDLPLELLPYLDVFIPENRINTTFCIWRLSDDICWQVGKVEYPSEDMDDGSLYFLGYVLKASAEEWGAYDRFADYDEEAQEQAFAAVQYVFDTLTISEQIARDINPDVDFAAIRERLIEVGIRVAD